MKRPHRLLLFGVASSLVVILAPIPTRADIVYVSNAGDNTIWKFAAGGAGTLFADLDLDSPLRPRLRQHGQSLCGQ